ncbi:GNAT family N-acetyltransferase [Paenibacillus oenotherae]|uniref:GNAT family N-acetyltransferase n=1 Tax=Paenibacillus oenotherae TaxID=1435645 RepID=A0ABS7DAY2_9BACL|nr:GNAT family N-acetyltransferase [Paenibacillus oenotherae]MBW7477089.1 GNAT family N-acetyltransferase [Paenibacillus oenotherae]
MEITYRETTAILPEDLARVFAKSGISRPYEDLERLKRMIANADIIISAWDGDKLVGIARALTDYSYCCYLSDLAVDGDYQRSGIGNELVKRVQARIGEECSLILLSAPQALDYYPKIGFTRTDAGFVIRRSR